MIEVPACTGQCCAVFYLPITAAEMTPAWMSRVADGRYIMGMVLPLTQDAAGELAAMHDISLPIERGAGHWYACRMWDDRSGLCRAYEERPRMCSRYPYGEPCLHCGQGAPS